MRSGWIVLAIVWVSTSCVWGNDRFPGTEQGAKDLLATFVQPGADLKALTQSLRPKAEDYEKVFMPEIAKKMQTMYAEPWEKGLIVVVPKAGQTSVLLFAATSEELQKWTGRAKEHFPGGYEKLGPHFQKGFTHYRFKFVVPGEELGMAYDGLVYVDGHWRLFPKAYRAVE